MKIFNLIQEKTSSFNLFISSKTAKVSKNTKKNRNLKKLQLLSIKKINETMTTATPIIKINRNSDTIKLASSSNTKRFVHIFNRINSSIGQYRHIKKRYSISSCSISVSVFNY